MLTLYYSLKSGLNVVGLLTTVNVKYRRVSMHGVREDLLDAQANALGLRLVKVYLPPDPSNREYEEAMSTAIKKIKAMGVDAIVFGDIFLRDVREYREKMLERTGIRPLFPLWGLDTSMLSRSVVDLGIKAVIASADPHVVDPMVVCSDYNPDIVRLAGPLADPCGERGEFHTFVYDSPLFKTPIWIVKDGIVKKDGYYYCDLRVQKR